MKALSRSLGSPSFHLAALVTLAALAVAASHSIPRHATPTGPEGHPANCHTCSAVPPGSAAAVAAYLVRSGCIEDPTGAE